MISDADRQKIDAMNLDDMEHILHNTPSFAWPFRNWDTGEYFYERYDKLRGEQDGHLADPD